VYGKAEQFAGDGVAVREFVVTLERTVLYEVTQLAEVEIAAASESEARSAAERMIANSHEFAWEDHDAIDVEPEVATVEDVEEIEDQDDHGEAEEEP
jgi:hypothetical protein